MMASTSRFDGRLITISLYTLFYGGVDVTLFRSIIVYTQSTILSAHQSTWSTKCTSTIYSYSYYYTPSSHVGYNSETEGQLIPSLLSVIYLIVGTRAKIAAKHCPMIPCI